MIMGHRRFDALPLWNSLWMRIRIDVKTRTLLHLCSDNQLSILLPQDCPLFDPRYIKSKRVDLSVNPLFVFGGAEGESRELHEGTGTLVGSLS